MHINRSQILLAIFFTVAGILHFVFPDKYSGIMPPWLGWHRELVFISGVFEVAGGLGILFPRTRRAAGIGLCGRFDCLFGRLAMV